MVVNFRPGVGGGGGVSGCTTAKVIPEITQTGPLIICRTRLTVIVPRAVSDSYTVVAPLHRRLPVTNKREAWLPYYGHIILLYYDCHIIFSPKTGPSLRDWEMLLLSTFINHIPPSYIFSVLFQRLFVYDSINSVNVMPFWDFLQSHFEVVLKIMTIAELFIVMTASLG